MTATLSTQQLETAVKITEQRGEIFKAADFFSRITIPNLAATQTNLKANLRASTQATDIPKYYPRLNHHNSIHTFLPSLFTHNLIFEVTVCPFVIYILIASGAFPKLTLSFNYILFIPNSSGRKGR